MNSTCRYTAEVMSRIQSLFIRCHHPLVGKAGGYSDELVPYISSSVHKYVCINNFAGPYRYILNKQAHANAIQYCWPPLSGKCTHGHTDLIFVLGQGSTFIIYAITWKIPEQSAPVFVGLLRTLGQRKFACVFSVSREKQWVAAGIARWLACWLTDKWFTVEFQMRHFSGLIQDSVHWSQRIVGSHCQAW